MSESANNENLELISIHGIKPLYFLPEDNIAEEVLIPSMHCALNVSCMIGFFTSQALVSIAPGLATFINSTKNSMQLIISPYLKAEDREAIEEGAKENELILAEYVSDLIITSDQIEKHTLHCLAYLIASNRIEIKIALMRNALFHPKVWIIKDKHNTIAVHGSMNMTETGILKNYEQVSVAVSWGDINQTYIIDKLQRQFDRLWNKEDEQCLVVDLSEALSNQILKDYYQETPPVENDFLKLYGRAMKLVGSKKNVISHEYKEPKFIIPTSLKYDSGPFEHQGEAVHAWCTSNYNGILEMATGSGKTITAMIAAYNLYIINHPLLIVVAAPYIPLIEQWCEEIEAFGLLPINLGRIVGRLAKNKKLKDISRKLRLGITNVEVVVTSHDTLCNPEFSSALQQIDCTKLLIADEVHNLGRSSFIVDPPEFFKYRLGLSATPERQFDEEGTEAVFDFFGEVVFKYTLEEAIGNCLVEYDYFIHPVNLNEVEMDKWYELTEKIKQNSWRSENGKPDDYLAKLFRDRRLILETASSKLTVLSELLDTEDANSLKHTLIYCSDKAPEQLRLVNQLLIDKSILFHQLTNEETCNRNKCKSIISSFQDAKIQILTCKRVLDEGVNIPQIEKAFILASTTVERQWIQRRGRLLRKCSSINKTHSTIHDFICLPPNLRTKLDEEEKNLIKSELRRIQKFASLARNAGSKNGPIHIIDKLVEAAF